MNAQNNDASLSFVNTIKWPGPDDWEHHRKTIEKLYLDENKTLKEVMSIMADKYDHRGTMKMYKSRITKWGLDKYHRASDVAFILRKKANRDAIKKPSAFRVQNKSVDMQEILRHLRRKANQGQNFRMPSPSALTPPHISCRTPTPELLSNAHDEYQQVQESSCNDRQPQAVFCHISQQNYMLGSSMDGGQQFVLPQIQRSFLRGTRVGHSQCFDSQRQGVLSVISPPQSLLVPERLFATITSYFDGSFRQGTWILNQEGQCVSRNALGSASSDPMKFYHYCEAASFLVIRQSPIKGSQVLSKAMALIPKMLQVEHPSILGNLFDAIFILKQQGLVGVVTMLLNYFCQMAEIVLSKDHPWFQISRLMTLIDAGDHTTPLSLSWRCATDAFGRSLGQLSPTSISCEIDFLRRVYGREDPSGLERRLRKLLADCEQARGPNDRCSLEVLCTLGYRLLEQRRYIEAESVGQDVLARAQEIGWNEGSTNALELAAKTQYFLGKQNMAEWFMRDAMKKFADVGERGSPDVLRIMLLLEGWLREWGRGDDADQLKREMAELVGPEDLDV